MQPNKYDLGDRIPIIRVIWAFITVATGFVPGIVAYGLAWLILPQSEEALQDVSA